MAIKIGLLSVWGAISCLSACSTTNPPVVSNNEPYHYPQTELYPDSYEGTGAYAYQEKDPVVVPESYHIGATISPTPHTDRDREWVNNQTNGYTIELASGDKASEVANTLFKAPKNQRTAEIKYQKDGKTYYRGVYGTYPTSEAAQEVLKSLPPDVAKDAGVKSWSNIQSSVGQ
jgi:septal ring-binding cell division protein DamX